MGLSIAQAIAIGKQMGWHVSSDIKIVAEESKKLYNLGEGLKPETEQTFPEIIAFKKKY